MFNTTIMTYTRAYVDQMIFLLGLPIPLIKLCILQGSILKSDTWKIKILTFCQISKKNKVLSALDNHVQTENNLVILFCRADDRAICSSSSRVKRMISMSREISSWGNEWINKVQHHQIQVLQNNKIWYAFIIYWCLRC